MTQKAILSQRYKEVTIPLVRPSLTISGLTRAGVGWTGAGSLAAFALEMRNQKR